MDRDIIETRGSVALRRLYTESKQRRAALCAAVVMRSAKTFGAFGMPLMHPWAGRAA